MIRILLVDDHPSVVEGTKHMLQHDPEMQVTVALSAMDALEMLETESFDVMLFDLNMPTINGLELTKRIIQRDPESIIIIYTGYEIGGYFNLLMDSGVSGFISKTTSREQLINAIRCAVRGESVVPTSLLKQLRRNEVSVSKGDSTIEKVSINEKEQEILQEVAKGSANKDIAAKMHMSQRSVEYHLTRIFEKLGVRSRSEAVAEAKRIGLIHEIELF